MSGDTVIHAEGLGKKYVIGHEAERERYTTLRDVAARNIRNFARIGAGMFRGRRLSAPPGTEEFWALRDINFEVRRGEVLGIIGRNGAGKSTLLKILSRITEPSEGTVRIKGRVASLLEVGTGFHPELTGRENIYLNGAILGMTRAEVRHKFDEIVAFADVARFLDTPVKRYSSGMYVRLAFAVAAHLEPEILIVDEVLAVGDAEFQKKCLGRMKEVSAGGRTVLFVSHNLDAITRLCGRAILLAGGRAQAIGDAPAIIARYHNTADRNLNRRSARLGPANFMSCISPISVAGAKATFSLAFQTDQTVKVSEFALIFNTANGTRVAVIDFRGCLPLGIIEQHVDNELVVKIDNFDLASGDYELSLLLHPPGGAVELPAGCMSTVGNLQSVPYLTMYPDQWNGITKFRGHITHLVHALPEATNGSAGPPAYRSDRR